LYTHIDQTENKLLPNRLHYSKSPVRETHTFTYTEHPAYQTALWQIAGQGDTHIHIHRTPCLPDCTIANRQSGRHTHSHKTLPTRLHQVNRRSGRHTHSHTQNPMPTRLYQVNRPSGRHTHSHTQNPLPTRLHYGKSPVRETHILTNPCLPDCLRQITSQGETHIHIHRTPAYQTALWQIAGQGDAHSHKPLPTRLPQANRQSGRDTHSHTQNPCLPECTMANRWSGRRTFSQTPAYQTALGKSPVRERHIHIHRNPCLPDCPMANHQSGRHTFTQALPTRRHQANRKSGRHIHMHRTPCLPDCTMANHWLGRHTFTQTPAYQTAPGKSPVKETHTFTYTEPPAYQTMANHPSGIHTHTHTHTQNNPCLPDCILYRQLSCTSRTANCRIPLEDQTQGNALPSHGLQWVWRVYLLLCSLRVCSWASQEV